jgi:hypothetical protein
MNRLAIICACLTLTACASTRTPDPIASAKPLAVDPRVCADIAPEPQMPPKASIVAPASAETQDATEAFLGWVAGVLDWGRVNAGRAEVAKGAACK